MGRGGLPGRHRDRDHRGPGGAEPQPAPGGHAAGVADLNLRLARGFPRGFEHGLAGGLRVRVRVRVAVADGMPVAFAVALGRSVTGGSVTGRCLSVGGGAGRQS
jgi:hypothetical protein